MGLSFRAFEAGQKYEQLSQLIEILGDLLENDKVDSLAKHYKEEDNGRHGDRACKACFCQSRVLSCQFVAQSVGSSNTINSCGWPRSDLAATVSLTVFNVDAVDAVDAVDVVCIFMCFQWPVVASTCTIRTHNWPLACFHCFLGSFHLLEFPTLQTTPVESSQIYWASLSITELYR